jgi:hypothetical protein
MERLVLDKRGNAVLIDLEGVTSMKYANKRWLFITKDGEFRDPSNALEYILLFKHVPFLKANPSTLLNMKNVYYVAARKAHTIFGDIPVSRDNQAKLRKFFKDST